MNIIWFSINKDTDRPRGTPSSPLLFHRVYMYPKLANIAHTTYQWCVGVSWFEQYKAASAAVPIRTASSSRSLLGTLPEHI